MAAVAAHPELYDALREAKVSESRARAAEHATLPAAQAATKAEVEKKMGDEIRPVDYKLGKLLTAAAFIGGLCIATFFFALNGWLNAKYAAEAIPRIQASIAQNERAILENRVTIEANAKAIEANRVAIEANRVAIEANSKKLDEIARNQEEILRLLRLAGRE